MRMARYDTVFRQPRGHRLKKFCKTWAVEFVRDPVTDTAVRINPLRERGEGERGKGERTERSARDTWRRDNEMSLFFFSSKESRAFSRVASYPPRLEPRAYSPSLQRRCSGRVLPERRVRGPGSRAVSRDDEDG